MDLWDLTKLLFRRWYFSLPMLLVTLTATLMVSSSVRPDYTASGHLQLIPPANPTPTEAGAPGATNIRNPWLDLGIQALGQAAILKIEDQSVVKALAAQGYSTNYVISIDYPSTFFTVQVTGQSQGQTANTVKKVMDLLSQDVKTEQSGFGVADRDYITTLALDQGEKVTVVTSKFKRVLIVAGGLSLLITAGFTIGLDALVRRLRIRRLAAASAGDGYPSEDEPAVVGAAPAPVSWVTEHQQRRPAGIDLRLENGNKSVEKAAAPVAAEPAVDATAVINIPMGGQLGVFQYLPNVAKPAVNGAVPSRSAGEPVRSPAVVDEPPTAPIAPEPRDMPSDATIVLPATFDDRKQETRSNGR